MLAPNGDSEHSCTWCKKKKNKWIYAYLDQATFFCCSVVQFGCLSARFGCFSGGQGSAWPPCPLCSALLQRRQQHTQYSDTLYILTIFVLCMLFFICVFIWFVLDKYVIFLNVGLLAVKISLVLRVFMMFFFIQRCTSGYWDFCFTSRMCTWKGSD